MVTKQWAQQDQSVPQPWWLLSNYYQGICHKIMYHISISAFTCFVVAIVLSWWCIVIIYDGISLFLSYYFIVTSINIQPISSSLTSTRAQWIQWTCLCQWTWLSCCWDIYISMWRWVSHCHWRQYLLIYVLLRGTTAKCRQHSNDIVSIKFQVPLIASKDTHHQSTSLIIHYEIIERSTITTVHAMQYINSYNAVVVAAGIPAHIAVVRLSCAKQKQLVPQLHGLPLLTLLPLHAASIEIESIARM